MATHKELITAGKFDEKFKRALLDYYSYGFKCLGSFDVKKHQTISEDWLRLNRIIADYMKWSEDRSDVMFASEDSQSMDSNPFHRIYRFCKYNPLTYPAYFLHTMVALSKSFQLRGGVDALGLDDDQRIHLEDVIERQEDLKTSDILLFLPNMGELDDPNPPNLSEHPILAESVELIQAAMGEVPKKISFKYVRSSLLKSNTISKEQSGKKYVVSPCYIGLHDCQMYLLALDDTKILRAFRIDHMMEIDVLRTQADFMDPAARAMPQRMLDDILYAQKHNSAVKTLNGRLEELARFGVAKYTQKTGDKGGKGDRRWSLPLFTMRTILDAGNEVSEDFEHHLYSALDFFSKYYLLGEVGTFLLDRIYSDDVSPFRFKHEYFMQALNDFNIIDLLYAIEHNKWCKIKYRHGIRNAERDILCYPLEIRISNMNGREFLMCYEPFKRSYTALRIEFIDAIEYFDDSKVKHILAQTGYHPLSETVDTDISNARESLKCSWGVSSTKEPIGNAQSIAVPHPVNFKIAYTPKQDYFIVNRLYRERRIGHLEKPDGSTYLHFSVNVSDETELRPWMRSFYSRIVSCDGMETDAFSLDDDIEDVVRVLIRDELPSKRQNSPKRILPRWEIPDDAKKLLGSGAKAREHDLLFNEVFCIYYYIIADVFVRLSSSTKEKSYNKQEILQAIEDSFNKFYLLIGQETESLLPDEILELLIDGGFLERIDRPIPGAYETVKNDAGTGYFKRQKTEKAYVSKYACEPGVELYRDVVPLTTLELRWLKTVINDQKMNLFFSGDEIALLKKLLNENAANLNALPMNKVVFFDRFRFTEKNTRRETAVLSTILEGIYAHKTVRLKYHTNHKGPRHGEFRPIVLEFSKRNNRFQGYFQKCKTGAIFTFNIAQIETAIETDTPFDYYAAEMDLAEYRKNNTTSVEIEFSNVKNIVDRILTEFSPWEKRCSYDAKTRMYRLTIFYQTLDELDLVVRLLGYGANIRFVDKAHPIFMEIQQRMNRQMDLIKERREESSVQEPGDNR